MSTCRTAIRKRREAVIRSRKAGKRAGKVTLARRIAKAATKGKA